MSKDDPTDGSAKPERQDEGAALRPKDSKRSIILLVLMAIFLGLSAVAAVMVFTIQSSYDEAQGEYAELREMATPTVGLDPAAAEAHSDAAAVLLEKNPDYIGWISIADTAIDYPVVRGDSNDDYMHTTFEGTNNASGAIFMDYRCRTAFGGHTTLLYGHNMYDGSMFAALNRYDEPEFLAAHPIVTICDLNGEFLNYRVFAVKSTNTDDEIFDLTSGAWELSAGYKTSLNMVDGAIPDDTAPILVLSTCSGSQGSPERILVFAVLE